MLLVAISAYAALRFRAAAHGRRRIVLVLHLLYASVLWLGCNSPIEGPILTILSKSHGITTSDLLVAVPALLALRLLRQHRA